MATSLSHLDRKTRERIWHNIAYQEIEKIVLEEIGLNVLKEWDNLSYLEKAQYKVSLTEIVDSVVWALQKKGKL